MKQSNPNKYVVMAIFFILVATSALHLLDILPLI